MDGSDHLASLTIRPDTYVVLHANHVYRYLRNRVRGLKKHTSSLHMSSWAVWAETIMFRAAGVTKPSSTALSMNDRSEL